MEHQKILNLLNEANDSKFVTRKWNIVNDNSKTNYGVGSGIIYNTEVLESKLCHYQIVLFVTRENQLLLKSKNFQVISLK